MPNNTGQKIQNETHFGRMYLFMPHRVLLHVNQRIPLHNHCHCQSPSKITFCVLWLYVTGMQQFSELSAFNLIRSLKTRIFTLIELFFFNPLNLELNPICYLLALLAHHFLHVSRIKVKSLTIRLLMSYIYIYIWSTYS